MKNKIKIYLDWNVIVEFLEGKFEWVEHILLSNHKLFDIPFSFEHVGEATNIKLSNMLETENEIHKRLNYLSSISSDLYFVNDMIVTECRVESPHSVYQTLNDVPQNFNPDKIFSNLIDFDCLKDSRKKLNLEPNILNNIRPADAINKIDKIIASTIASEKQANEYIEKNNIDVSFMGILRKALEISEESHSNTSYNDIIKKKKTYDLNNLVVMSFSLLDTFGFWADKKSTYIRGSRFPDSRHAFNAIFMDILISNDKRFCMKSDAVYRYLNLGPEVYYLADDSDKIKDFLKARS